MNFKIPRRMENVPASCGFSASMWFLSGFLSHLLNVFGFWDGRPPDWIIIRFLFHHCQTEPQRKALDPVMAATMGSPVWICLCNEESRRSVWVYALRVFFQGKHRRLQNDQRCFRGDLRGDERQMKELTNKPDYSFVISVPIWLKRSPKNIQLLVGSENNKKQ